MPFGLSTLLFSAFTFNPSFSSMNRVTLFITRSAACLLPTIMMRSSAYRTKSSPLASSSLSSSFSMMFANSGDMFPPCGVPTMVSSYSSSIIIPLTRNFLTTDMTSPSLIVRPKIVISLSWSTVSKNFSRSMSTIQLCPSFIISNAFRTACCAHLLGLNP